VKQIKKSKWLIILVIIVMLLGLLTLLKIYHHQIITGYEDTNGNIYECSRPIKAEMGNATILGHPQGLVPVDQADADKYCYHTGVE
jgi:hypothetical protein